MQKTKQNGIWEIKNYRLQKQTPLNKALEQEASLRIPQSAGMCHKLNLGYTWP